MSRWPVVLIALALAACERPPRSESYFRAHPEEAIKVDARCRSGVQRGDECATAQAGVAQAAFAERDRIFRRGIEK